MVVYNGYLLHCRVEIMEYVDVNENQKEGNARFCRETFNVYDRKYTFKEIRRHH